MAEKVFMIALSPTMEEGTIVAWRKQVGQTVKIDEVICDVETDKAVMEYVSTQEGTLLHIEKKAGSNAKIGDIVAIIGQPGEDFSSLLVAAPPPPASARAPVSQAVLPSASTSSTVAQENSASARIKSSPLARQLAKQRGIDLARIAGSGPEGRIIKADVVSAPSGNKPIEISGKTSPTFAPESDTLVPVSRKRAVVAKRLGESKDQSPHFYLTVSVAMDGLMSARERINAANKEKLGLNSFLVKIVAQALKKHPYVNASWEGENIRLFGSQDVALAVAQSDGLITPIVRHCGLKGIVQIDAELKVLIDKARQGSLKPEEFTGATFTISNLGSFGIEEFTSIINPPGSAILALGTVKPTPVVNEEGQIIVKKLMKVTLSCDHRVIDGAVGAAFLTAFQKMVEDPYTALL